VASGSSSRRAAIVVLVGVGAIALWAFLLRPSPNPRITASGPDLGVAEVSVPLPRLEGETIPDGDRFGPEDHEGRVLVVNFWATWCAPCRVEQPDLQRVWERYRSRGVVFVGVNYRDTTPAALDWIRDFGVTYPSLEDPAGSYADDFGFLGMPDTYVVDGGGTIRYAITGPTTEEQLSALLDELLAELAADGG
jgi:cytochrome c biogenesis protein CcmG/thiol:disulfide interchange protein DsbE